MKKLEITLEQQFEENMQCHTKKFGLYCAGIENLYYYFNVQNSLNQAKIGFRVDSYEIFIIPQIRR